MTLERTNNMKRMIFLICISCVVASVLTGCGSHAYVKTVDQNGEPIVGVKLITNVQPGNAFFSKDETTVSYTDEAGFARVPVDKWFHFRYVEKDGYQFAYERQFIEQFGHDILGSSADRFTKTNPLIIHGWKGGEEPVLTYANGEALFDETVDHCTVELVKATPKNGLSKSIYATIRIKTHYIKDEERGVRLPDRMYKSDSWSGELSVSRALVQKTDDLFQNLAPENGYTSSVNMGGDSFSESDENYQYLYIKAESGEFYGGAHLIVGALQTMKGSLDEFDPRERHLVHFQYWFNLDGSPNTLRPNKEVTRHGSSFDDIRYECIDAKP